MKIIKPKIIIEDLDYTKIMKNIEKACRTCYRSEDKITKDSYKTLLKNCINRGHESVLEHEKITIQMICDIGVYKDLTRHRHASFSIESTRYCVAGDTRLKFFNGHSRYTIKEMYEKMHNSKNGQWKRMKIKHLNESTGEFDYVTIKNLFYNGKKKCYKIKTDLGYELICTVDHKIYTPQGYKKLEDLVIGDKVYVNGQDADEPLCPKCHQGIENKSLNILHADTIVDIEDVGEVDVYDLEVNSEYHNFVANGVIVHNCNYNKDKFDNQLHLIEPIFYENSWNEAITLGSAISINEQKSYYWHDCMKNIEQTYNAMIELGSIPDEARMILPHSTAATVTMTANIREWKHILELRCTKHAHPSVQQVMIPLLLYFKEKMPEIFNSIEYNKEFDKSKYAELEIREL